MPPTSLSINQRLAAHSILINRRRAAHNIDTTARPLASAAHSMVCQSAGRGQSAASPLTSTTCQSKAQAVTRHQRRCRSQALAHAALINRRLVAHSIDTNNTNQSTAIISQRLAARNIDKSSTNQSVAWRSHLDTSNTNQPAACRSQPGHKCLHAYVLTRCMVGSKLFF